MIPIFNFRSLLPISFLVLFICFPLLHFFDGVLLYLRPVLMLLAGLLGLAFVLTDNKLGHRGVSLPQLCPPILFVIVIVYVHQRGNITGLVFLATVWLLLHAIFIVLLNFGQKLASKLIVKVFVGSTLAGVLLFVYSYWSGTNVYYQNNSIYAILLALQILFLMPWGLRQNKKLYYGPSLLLVFAFGILILTKGRAAIIGLSAGFLLYLAHHTRAKLVSIIGAIALACLFIVLVYSKAGSSQGRILIYKVLYSELKPSEYFTGIGYGQFKARYNEMQATYFSKKGIDTKDALLADNTYFLFNDVFQLIIETGIWGFLFLTYLMYKLILYYRIGRKNFKQNSILHGAYLSLFGVGFVALFSYPFQNLGILCIALSAISIIEHNYSISNKSKKNVNHVIIPPKVRKVIYITVAGVVIAFSFHYLSFIAKAQNAAYLSKNGYRAMALARYKELANDIIKDGQILYLYAAELRKVKKIDSALIILKQASKYLYNDDIVLLKASLYKEKGYITLVEKHLKESVCMVPKLFGNRFELFQFYCQIEDTINAKYWGRSILALPEKIPSEKVKAIKKRTLEMLTILQLSDAQQYDH